MTVNKANLRKQIDKDVKTFLDKGGVIEKVKPRLTKLEKKYGYTVVNDNGETVRVKGRVLERVALPAFPDCNVVFAQLADFREKNRLLTADGGIPSWKLTLDVGNIVSEMPRLVA